MQFHEYGDNDKNTIMVVHGMICDWRKFREIFKTLEQAISGMDIHPTARAPHQGVLAGSVRSRAVPEDV